MAAPKGNKYAVGNNGGQPPKYKSAKELINSIEGYFQYILGDLKEERETVNNRTGATEFILIWNREPEPATVTGLALYLGFESRQSLHDYEKKEEFSYIIKKARLMVEHGYEKALHGDKPTGAIFALKNMGWADKLDIDANNNNTNYNSKPLTKEEIQAYHELLESKY